MMFPKPTKQPKEKKQYSSLQQRKNKPKKEIAPWRQGILSHHQSKPSRADRADFPRKVVEDLIIETNGLCQCCGKLQAETTHHVMPRGRGGRGVRTNAMRLNWICHDRIQTNEEELQYWISDWERKHGPNFWFDDQDWEDYNRKQAAIQERELEKRQRTENIEPIVNLLSVVTGRSLKAKEIRLLERMNDNDMTIFAKLMYDVVGAGIAVENKPTFGYGNFDD